MIRDISGLVVQSVFNAQQIFKARAAMPIPVAGYR